MMSILLIVLVLWRLPQGQGIKAFDCDRPEVGATYSLVDLEKCPDAEPDKLITEPTTKYYIYQENKFFRVKALECKLTKQMKKWHCGKAHTHSTNLLIASPDEPQRVLPDDCKEAVKSGKLKVNDKVEISTIVNGIKYLTVNEGGEVGKDGTCTGQTVDEVSRIVVQNLYTWTVTDKEITFDADTLKLMIRMDCMYGNGYCFTTDSVIAWNVEVVTCNLAFIKATTFNITKGVRFSKPTKPHPDDEDVQRLTEIETPAVLMSIVDDAVRLIRK